MYPLILRVHLNKGQRLIKWCLCDVLCFPFSDFLYKSICCRYSFEAYRQVDAIQIITLNICLYKVDKKYNGYNLKTTELLDCGLIGVCAVIGSNTVNIFFLFLHKTCLYGYSYELPLWDDSNDYHNMHFHKHDKGHTFSHCSACYIYSSKRRKVCTAKKLVS